MVDSRTECDITVYVNSQEETERLLSELQCMGIEVRNVSNPTFLAHLGGKIQITPKRPILNNDDLSRIYTPGVAQVCLAIKADRSKVWDLTMKGNSILVVTDGTRILGLGDIGPEAGLPVMEGKAALFAQLGNVNAVPLVLGTKDPDEIVQAIVWASPGYGGINLEDIESPKCWYVERRLKELLDIPVFHDDQHGTAVVVLAAAYNAARLVGKKLKDMKIVASGVGAAGMASCNLLIKAGARHLFGFNREGAIFRGRADMNDEERRLAMRSNKERFTGTLHEAMRGADMFLGLSGPNLIDAEHVKSMAPNAIVFALANPVPEIDPNIAAKYARVVATGGSEYPNQINNALVFPGIFRGALDARATEITDRMKLAAARALARVIKPSLLREHNIIPSAFDPRPHEAVAEAVRKVAHKTGKARRDRKVR
jgi:malate dehydrogenase (oxaloacetate-decarboxylating)